MSMKEGPVTTTPKQDSDRANSGMDDTVGSDFMYYDKDGRLVNAKVGLGCTRPIKYTYSYNDPPESIKTQVGGSHYTDMAIQPRDYINANNLGYDEANVIKYVSRHKKKGGRRDIEKAIHCLEMILEDQYD